MAVCQSWRPTASKHFYNVLLLNTNTLSKYYNGIIFRDSIFSQFVQAKKCIVLPSSRPTTTVVTEDVKKQYARTFANLLRHIRMIEKIKFKKVGPTHYINEIDAQKIPFQKLKLINYPLNFKSAEAAYTSIACRCENTLTDFSIRYSLSSNLPMDTFLGKFLYLVKLHIDLLRMALDIPLLLNTCRSLTSLDISGDGNISFNINNRQQQHLTLTTLGLTPTLFDNLTIWTHSHIS